MSSEVKSLALHLAPYQTWAIPKGLLTSAAAESQTTAAQTIATLDCINKIKVVARPRGGQDWTIPVREGLDSLYCSAGLYLMRGIPKPRLSECVKHIDLLVGT